MLRKFNLLAIFSLYQNKTLLQICLKKLSNVNKYKHKHKHRRNSEYKNTNEHNGHFSVLFASFLSAVAMSKLCTKWGSIQNWCSSKLHIYRTARPLLLVGSHRGDASVNVPIKNFDLKRFFHIQIRMVAKISNVHVLSETSFQRFSRKMLGLIGTVKWFKRLKFIITMRPPPFLQNIMVYEIAPSRSAAQ